MNAKNFLLALLASVVMGAVQVSAADRLPRLYDANFWIHGHGSGMVDRFTVSSGDRVGDLKKKVAVRINDAIPRERMHFIINGVELPDNYRLDRNKMDAYGEISVVSSEELQNWLPRAEE